MNISLLTGMAGTIAAIMLLIVIRNRLLPLALERLSGKQRSLADFMLDVLIIALALALSIYTISNLEESAQLITVVITVLTGAFIFTSEGWFQDVLGGISLKISGLFLVDDIVTIAGKRGRASHIGLFRTLLETPTLDVISVRNSVVMQDTIVNHSGIRYRKVSIVVHTADYGSYENDIYSYVADVEKIAQKVQREICPDAVTDSGFDARAFFTEFGSSSDYIEVSFYSYDRDEALKPALGAMHMAMAAELRPKGVILGQVNATTIDNVLQHQQLH